jgi:hypothetical protein
MPQQLHECRKADTEADHFRCITVPELVTGYRMGAVRSSCSSTSEADLSDWAIHPINPAP